MQLVAQQLEDIVTAHRNALLAIPDNVMEYKPLPGKWSKKEILGHLSDSAQNNIRRFVVAQYEDKPCIVYNQDKWVAAAGYQHYETSRLVDLWSLLNLQIVSILRNISSEAAQRSCQTQELHTIEWLATDYIKHLRHHLHQVLDLEEVAYP